MQLSIREKICNSGRVLLDMKKQSFSNGEVQLEEKRTNLKDFLKKKWR